MAALGAARRLVGEDASALELVDRHLVRDGIDDARIERGRDAVGAVRAAVEPRLEVAARDVARAREAGLDPHQNRMPAAVDVEHLLAREGDLDGTARELRELARGDLVREGIELAAEASAHRGRDHADVRGRDVEDLREEPMDVMRRLRRRPQRQLAVRRPVRDRGVLLHRQVRVAFEIEDVFAHEVRLRERRLHVAELERDVLVDVRAVPVLVDADLGMRERGFDGHQRGQCLVLDLDELARTLRRVLVDRGDGGHGVAHHPHLLDAQRFLVLGHRQDPEFHARQIRTGDDAVDAGQGARAARVDARDPRVRVRAAQQLAERHAWQDEVVGVFRLTRHLRPRVDLRQRLTDDGEPVFRRGAIFDHFTARLAGGTASARTAILRDASSTASRIFV